MAALQFTPLSVGYAAQFVFFLVISFSLLNIPRKSPAAWLLGTVFLLNTCTALLLWITEALPAWQPYRQTIHAVWFLAVLVPLLQFAYAFPYPLAAAPAEVRRILSVSIGFFVVGLGAALLSVSGLLGAHPADEVVIAAVFGGVQLAWLLGIFVRQGFIPSGEAGGGPFSAKTRRAQAARAYLLLICLALLAGVWLWIDPAFSVSPAGGMALSLAALWFGAAAAFLFYSNAAEQTGLLHKFIILSLGTLLSVVVVCAHSAEVNTRFLLVMASAVLVSQALFYAVFRAVITRPLARLTAGIAQVNAGDWQTEVEALANDEIGYISQSFTSIIRTVEIAAKALRQSNLSLQQKIDEQKQLIAELHLAHERLQNVSRHFVETQEKERRRLAGELHDEVGQALTGIKLTLEMSRKMPQEEPRRLEEAQEMMMDLIHRVNDLSLDLRPVMLDEFGLLPALLYFFDNYTRQTGVVVFFQQNDLEEKRFSPQLETAVYRIIQEALTNCARYAQVNEVSVRILMNEGSMLVEVDDHGVGFDSAAQSKTGFTYGIAGMMERAALIGGKLDVESSPGSGTFVCARLPIQITDKNKSFELEKEYSG